MKTATLSSLFSLVATLASAYPAAPSVFYLATTSQSEPTSNSSLLRAVSATSLFDPYNQPLLLLRLTGPGYGSVPNFTLSTGTLHTTASGPHGVGTYEYNSTTVTDGKELSFASAAQPEGNIGLDQGYLLTVGGDSKGWRICDGALDQAVIFWRGNGTSCNQTYVHAVTTPPY